MFDLALSSEQDQLCDSVRSLLTRQCSADVVRASEATGHDPALWKQISELGLVDPEVPVLDLALVAELLGEFLAPVPLLDSAVAARIGPAESLATRPPVDGTLVAVPSGAVAQHVVFLHGDDLAVTTDPVPSEPVPNLGGLAVADRSTADCRVLVQGPDAAQRYSVALAEWKALTASWLVGAGTRALALGVEYASEREAFGVKVASFQAIAHRLTDVATDLEAARLLAREAAWAHDSRPPDALALSSMALILAAEAAGAATRDALHVFGGYGFMLEYDIQLYFRRVKATTLVVGDIAREADRLADLLWGAA